MAINPDKTYEALVKAGEEWADADAAASLLEETKSAVRARLMLEAEGTTASAKEMYALADPDYDKHIKSMVSARKLANKMKVRYDSAKVLAEMRRSEESTRRAEMNLR